MTLASESLRFWTLAGAGLVAGLVALAVLIGNRQHRSLIGFRRQFRPEHDEPSAVDRETLVLLAAGGGLRRAS